MAEEAANIVQCKNLDEALKDEKELYQLVKGTIQQFQCGLNAQETDVAIKDVYTCFISEAKDLVKKVYDPVKVANHAFVFEMVKDPDGKCIWDCLEDSDEESKQEGMDATTLTLVAKIVVKKKAYALDPPNAADFIQIFPGTLMRERQRGCWPNHQKFSNSVRASS